MANITDWAFDVMQAGKGACRLRDIGIGRLFEVGGVEFIKCDEQGNTVPAIAKNVWKKSIFSRRSNDFRESEILADLKDNFLPIIINQAGIEGVTECVTHLKSLDGLNQYGDIRSLVSIPDLEFYREYAEIIEPYRVDKWWWLQIRGVLNLTTIRITSVLSRRLAASTTAISTSPAACARD